MKNIILIILLVMFTVGCKGSKQDEHNHKEGHSHAETEKHDHDKDDHNHSEDNHEGEKKKEAKDDGHRKGKKDIHLNETQIKAAKIKISPIEKINIRKRIDVTGSIQVPPQSISTIYAPLEAFVESTKLLVGDKVYKGQVVATLRHPNFTELQYNYLEAINKLNVEKQAFERAKMLFDNDILSKKSYLLAESSYRSAKNLIQSYASQLKMAGISPKTVAHKGIQQFIYVKSPISGYVSQNNLSKGKFLSVNEEMIQIINDDNLHAELNIFSTDIGKINKKDEFVFRPDGIDKEYRGKIKLIGQTMNNQTKSVIAHGIFNNKDKDIKAGTFINAQILLGAKHMAYAVPKNAVIDFEGKKVVFKQKNNIEFVPLVVTLGSEDNDFVELKTIEGNDFNIKIVKQGSHILKGELLKSTGEMDGHGHAH
ncbi:MAG: efflux RND transporter periplasmic adaptor subunit [Tenacibaculum sp.]|nr:efflux RND transporter periplasmic adaptor subunit [Tenacibaculum sp.]